MLSDVEKNSHLMLTRLSLVAILPESESKAVIQFNLFMMETDFKTC